MKKKFLFVPFYGALFFTGCNSINQTMSSLEANRQAIEYSTAIIYENAQAIEEANKGIIENRKKLEKINETLEKASKS
jgi:methyl-accepting chemotaxis protein